MFYSINGLDYAAQNTHLDLGHGDRDVPGLHSELHTLPLVGGKPLGLSCSLTAVLPGTAAAALPGARRTKARETE